ncbi:MAG: heparinase II/III-family protein, partial [Bacteroidota bacterium]|nr:heparinase II/III-family protein [Bacteroidota bacterium]
LSIGAILFQRGDFKQKAKQFSQDALWLWGTEGFEKYQMLKEPPLSPRSQAFEEGGFYIMQDENLHLFVDAGDIGMDGRGGHGHNDVLSFEFWLNGAPLIVDSGTYAYTFDVKARQEFRSTRAHNTVAVDGGETAEFTGLWAIKEDNTQPRVIEWRTSEKEDILEAEHCGYAPVIHRRRFYLNKKNSTLVITDTLEGSGEHNIESFLHFAPEITVDILDKQRAVARAQHSSYLITADSGDFSIAKTWFSKSYGVREQNETLRLFVKAQLPLKVQCKISAVGRFEMP